MYKQLVEKARERRRIALRETRMPQLNIFWDGTPRQAPSHTVVAQMTDLRVRMAPAREALVGLLT